MADLDLNEEFQRLLQQAIDGQLTPIESSRLQELVGARPERMEELVDHLLLDSLLAGEVGTESVGALVDFVTGVSPQDESGSVNRKYRSRWLRPYSHSAVVAALTAAAALVLYLTLSDYRNLPPPSDLAGAAEPEDTVAVLAQTVDAQWGDAGSPPLELRPGRLELRQGSAVLRFYSGATVYLQGPAELELVSVQQAILHRGRLRAIVPSQAEGFTVLTSNVRLVDRGTEFGMVAADERSQVHVFSGRIDLYPPADKNEARRRSFLTGESVEVAADFRISETHYDSSRFPLPETLLLQASEHHRRWKEASRTLRTDSRLVFYYDFEEPRLSETTLNRAAKTDVQATIVGCDRMPGRWAEKAALGFSRKSDRLRIRVPGDYPQLSFVCWLRVESLHEANQALLMSDAFDAGNPHLQITRDGRVNLGVGHQDPAVRRALKTYSLPVFHAASLGRWVHVATVYDSVKRRVAYFADGQLCGSQTLSHAVPLQIGLAEIGNWLRPRETGDEPVRNLIGRIDEFALFDVALDEAAIRRLYEVGRP